MALKLGDLVAYLRTDNKQLIQGLDEGKRDFERTGDQMDKDAKETSASVASSWAAKLAEVSRSWRSTGRQAAESLDKTAADTTKVDAEIDKVKRSVRELNLEFARTGDKELLPKISHDRSLLRQLEHVRKELRGVGDDADRAGGESSRGFVGRFQSALASLPGVVGKVFGSLPPMVSGPVAIAGAAIAVILVAAIGAGLAAGMLLLVGGGVLAAGIKAASDSPQVKSAWSKFGDRAKAAFKDFGKPFEGPAIRAAKTFGDAMERMAPTLKEMGRSMAPVIDKLAPALASMAEKALPGIQKAMEASKPLFDTLAEKAPEIGEAVSKFFDKMAQAGPGANMFLRDFIDLLMLSLDGFGDLIFGLSKIYEGVHWLWSKIKSAFVDGVAWILSVIGQIIGGAAAAFGWMPGIGPKLKKAASEFSTFATRANTALASIRDKEIKITVRKHEAMFGKPGTTIGGIGGSGFKGLASGGPFRVGDVNWVGENGPELVKWESSGTVIPNHVASRAASGGGGGGLSGTLRVILQYPDGRVIRDQIVDAASLRGQTPARYLNISTS